MKQLSLLFICAFFYNIGFAQERAQADVSIISVKLGTGARASNATVAKKNSIQPATGNSSATKLAGGQNLTCSITTHNENDDDAYETMLVVVLPVEVAVVSMPANAVVHKAGSNSPFAGYISITLGHMTVGQNITVEFSFTKSKYGNKVGAYAFSATPDPNPTNNYKEANF